MRKLVKKSRLLPSGPEGLEKACDTQSEPALRALLLDWFRHHGRSLPWRDTRDPYAVWISEVMLQQTQVARVIPYYTKFLKRFPSVKALARASWRELLPSWRGLGYYARGRNVLKTAKLIADRGGDFPKDIGGLEALPGIGRYTASAIASFAFGVETPAVDTNVRRVIGRLTGTTGLEIEVRAAAIFRGAGASSGALNHALMDVGALICTSRAAHCETCPLRSACVSASTVAPSTELPRASRAAARSRRPDVAVAAACIHRGGRYLIARRASGAWEFPGGKKEQGEDIRACLKREIREELGIEIAVRPAFLTHDFEKNGKLHRLHFCRSQILRGEPRCLEHAELAWVAPDELDRYPFPPTNLPAIRRLTRERVRRSAA